MNFFANFWDIIWFFFWTFAFVAYLFAIFAVVTDIFRDHSLNGWLKAVWLIALVFVPFLTVLVYVIARGDGMSRRTARSQSQARAQTDAYIRDAAGTSPADEIQKAKGLLDAGSITTAEYESLKASALAGAHSAGSRDGSPMATSA